jgi:membrane-bound lytic murein transglycosylase A
MKKCFILVCLILSMVSCAKRNLKPVSTSCDCAQVTRPNPATELTAEPKPTSSDISPDYAQLKPASWQDIDGFSTDDLSAAWPAWLQSCAGLKNKLQNNQPLWQTVCTAAQVLNEKNLNKPSSKASNKPSSAEIIDYYTSYFNVYSANNIDGTSTGLVTGYYQPMLKGSRTKSAKFAYPLYRQPSDLITVDLAELYPELKYKRVRGKLVGNKLVPYATRAQIETAVSPLAGNELVWVDDIVEAFFLQVQGSGLIKLDNGDLIQVGYADQNGQAYNSIGRILIERGELTKDQAGMQGIKNWAVKNPAKLQELLNANPSYVFFRELPAGLTGPLGALGVPLTVERSVAVDPKFIPLGAPVFLSTTQPNTQKPLKRLMLAQDTGGAIKGGVRADFFWGAGDEAGKQAGNMKQQGKIWVLLPKGFDFAAK